MIYLHSTAERLKKQAKEEFNLDLNLNEFDECPKTAADAAEAIDCEVVQPETINR